MSGNAGALPECDDTRSHILSDAQLWVGSSRNLSVFHGRSQHETPQGGSGLLNIKQVGCTPRCSTDAGVD